MKKQNIILINLLLLSIFSCRKEVEINIEGEDPRLVVNASITTQKQPWTVTLTKSVQFFSDTDIPFVDDAKVTITEDNNKTYELFYTDSGKYVSLDTLQCKVNSIYRLNIIWQGKEYAADELCKPQNDLDTFHYYYFPTTQGFIEEGYYGFIIGKEKDGQGDYYWWLITVNDTLNEGFTIDSDQINVSIFNEDFNLEDIDFDNFIFPRPIVFDLELGDHVKIEQRSCSRLFYEFLSVIQEQANQAGSPFDAPPADGEGNISNGALGYFSVHSSLIKEFTITE